MEQKSSEAYPPILGGFVAWQCLWDESADGGALFPTEPAARWFIRKNRAALVQAGAIAIHCRRMYVHREKFETVARELALQAAA